MTRVKGAWRPPGGWHNWVLGLACMVLIAIAVTSIGSSSSGAESAERTAEVGRGVVQSTVSGNGSLEAAEQVELDFGASGEVTDIYVQEGERVSKGEILARIDSSSAEASLASAEAQLAEAEETLEAAQEAEVSTSYGSSGTTVLASFVSEDADTTQPEGAEPEQGEEPKQEPKGKEESEQPKTSKEGAANGGESGGSTPAQEAPAEEGTPATGGSSMEGSGAGATVSVATAEANVRQAELSVQSAEQEVRETALRAPFSGTVASLSGAVGETVSGEASGTPSSGGSSTSESSSAGGLGALLGGGSSGGSGGGSSSSSESSSAFIVLSRLDQLKVQVSFSESDIGEIEVGQPATVSISSMEGVELAGRVTKVDVLPGEGSGGVVEYPATILLTQRAKGLRAGMSATVEVVVDQVTNAITVPSEAISSGPTKTVTVKEDGSEVQKEVTTGLEGDESTEVLSGVEPGETLVLPELTAAPSGITGGGEGGIPDFGGGGFPSFGGGGFPGGAP